MSGIQPHLNNAFLTRLYAAEKARNQQDNSTFAIDATDLEAALIQDYDGAESCRVLDALGKKLDQNDGVTLEQGFQLSEQDILMQMKANELAPYKTDLGVIIEDLASQYSRYPQVGIQRPLFNALKTAMDPEFYKNRYFDENGTPRSVNAYDELASLFDEGKGGQFLSRQDAKQLNLMLSEL